MNIIPRLLLSAFFVVAVGLVSPHSSGADNAPVIVTVTGEVSNPNRGTFDAFDDALFNTLGVTFEKAHAMTFDALAALPQSSISLRYDNWPKEVKLSGPRLVDVLEAAGAQGELVIVRGVDGYAPEFEIFDVRAGADKFILAITADGAPLSVGGRGPAWLALPPNSYPAQSDDDAALVWAVFNIEVK